MRRLRILIWHVHGSYLDAITSAEHDWYLPVTPGPDGYSGRRWSSPEWVHEVPAGRARELELDLVIYQSPRNYLADQHEILTRSQRRIPRIFLEHDPPRQHPTDTRHPVDDPLGKYTSCSVDRSADRSG